MFIKDKIGPQFLKKIRSFGGDGEIRTLEPFQANAFRVRPVMTTSIRLLDIAKIFYQSIILLSIGFYCFRILKKSDYMIKYKYHFFKRALWTTQVSADNSI